MDIYQHFRIEERAFIDQVLSWKEDVEKFYENKLSDFLDPREQYIIQAIIGKNSDVQVHFFGGREDVERKKAILAPYYETITSEIFNVTLLESKYANKYVQLTHRDVLGTLLSLGIKRKKIGDLIVDDGIIQIICDQQIASFLQLNLTQIKRSNIKLTEGQILDLKKSPNVWEKSEKTVSSLRLDAVLKEIYHISRGQAAESISKGYIKVNFRVVESPSFQMEEGDIISFRKKGRSKIEKIDGKTKKDKWRITTAVLK